MLFFFNDTATTEIYTLSLHDALPIYGVVGGEARVGERRYVLGLQDWVELHHSPGVGLQEVGEAAVAGDPWEDRKSTRLNSSHANISYAVFCLKKKTQHSKLVIRTQST